MNNTIINSDNLLNIQLVNKLPEDVIFIIKEYIPESVLMILTKENYMKYHPKMKYMIPLMDYSKYIRSTIRNDYYFVFEQLLRENIFKWYNMKKFIYQNMIFDNYLRYLNQLCIDYKSNKCRNLIKMYADKEIGKKWYKKTRVTNNRWKFYGN